ncbi:MAG: hypothetical protein JRF22_03980 [Deltaproteobacteria bacterium]|nr:hypothetical protein [Deltaproteobacteria bacterium]
MKRIILDYLNHITLGDKQTYNNMVIFPLFYDKEISIDYILFDEAIETNQVVITEDFEDGIVTELMIENLSGENILILDGEELVGTKQKRAANITMLIPAHSVVAIPISCVERSRWYYQGRGIMSKDRVLLKRNMAVNESLLTADSFPSDKGESRNIWDMVSKEKTPYHVDAPTRIIDNACEHEHKTIDEYLHHFNIEDNQVGILVMSNNNVVGCDYFGKYDTLSKTFSKLIKNYVLDTIDTDKKKCTFSKRKACGFLNDIGMSTVKGRPSISLGTDLRLESQKVTGSALSLGKALIHLTAFDKKGKDISKKVRLLKRESRDSVLNVSAVR